VKTILSITLIALAVAGCDLLETRTPEKPSQDRTDFTTATTPEILFQNLKDSFKDKVVENYLACFVDTLSLDKKYRFIPAASALSQYPILNNWNLNSEKQYFNNLKVTVKENSPITLELTSESKNLLGDSAVFQYDYQLTIPKEESETVYKGISTFKILQDNKNQWVIVEWEDSKNEDAPTWSKLKGEYY
jgi:hypothetical protein